MLLKKHELDCLWARGYREDVPASIPLLAGLGVGFSLIIAIGAQNLFVLRQGIRRDHIWVVIAICAVSDAVLVVAGVSGLGAAVQHVSWLVVLVRWAGGAFLVTYGLMAASRAIRRARPVLEVDVEEELGSDPDRAADELVPTASSQPVVAGPGGTTTIGRASVVPRVASSAATIALTTLALTWLNPHVYLDTLFLLGSIANTYGDGRWLFAAGAVTASLVWFTALGVGARHLGRLLSSERAWRILDGVIAVVMITLGVLLVAQT